MARTTHYKRMAVAGLSVAVLVAFIIAAGIDGIGLAPFVILLTVAAIGAGTLFPVTTISVQNAVPHHNLGIATAVLSFTRSLGSAIGVAVVGAVAFGGGSIGAEGSGEAASAMVIPADAYFAVYFTAAIIFAAALLVLATMRELPLGSGDALRAAETVGTE